MPLAAMNVAKTMPPRVTPSQPQVPPPTPKEEPGYFQKLLNDPTRMALLRYGTGVLGGQQPGASMDSAIAMRNSVLNPVDSYTLAPGQVRFSGANQKVASVPPLPTKGLLGTREMRNWDKLMSLPAGPQRDSFREMLMRSGGTRTSKAIQNYEKMQSIKNDKTLTEEEKQSQLKRLAEFKKHHKKKAPAALERLQKVALSGDNIFAELMNTVRSCSLGQITRALYDVGGQYRRNM